MSLRSKLRLWSLGAAIALALAMGCASRPLVETPRGTPEGTAGRVSQSERLILVGIDGFRWDFRDRGETPSLDSLVARAATARKLVPIFPTKTFPNHYTIATGLYAENHGLVANNIYDPKFDATYALRKREEVQNGRWYAGEPIWVTAEQRGLITAPVFWPGSEAEIAGVRPTHWEPFDGSRSDEERVDALLALLDLPTAERPVFLTLYFDVIDHAAHTFGPEPSAPLEQAVEHVDAMIGRLLAGLEARALDDSTDLLLVSDHGMSANSRERVVFVDDFVDLEMANAVDWDPILGLWPREQDLQRVFERLADAHPHLQIYRREEIPEELHYRNNHRIPPIIGIADDGWAVTSRDRFARCTTCFTGGSHGFDNRLESMGALFIAAGPSFAAGTRLPELANIHLYELMCAVLGLRPAPNDGSFEAVAGLLRPTPAPADR